MIIFVSHFKANTFANLWNAQANVASQINENAFAFNPMTMPMHTMPSFALPPMPPMIFTPPPTIPPNLDQLTDEELRQLEGNERVNIAERLKVWSLLYYTLLFYHYIFIVLFQISCCGIFK